MTTDSQRQITRVREARRPPAYISPEQHSRAYRMNKPLGARPVQATCALCGWRDATDHEEVDGVRVAVCAACSTARVPPPAETPTMRERVLRALARADGLGINELAEILSEDDAAGRARISAALARAIRAGFVSCTGGKMSRTYRLVVR